MSSKCSICQAKESGGFCDPLRIKRKEPKDFIFSGRKYQEEKKHINVFESTDLLNQGKSLKKEYGKSEYMHSAMCCECRKHKEDMDRHLDNGYVYVVCLECGAALMLLPNYAPAKNARMNLGAGKKEHVQLIFDSCADHE